MVCSKLKGCYILHKWMQKWDVHTFVLSWCPFCIWLFVATFSMVSLCYPNTYLCLWEIGTGWWDSNWSRKTEHNCSRFASWRGREPREPTVCQKQIAKQKKCPKEGEREGSGRAKAAAAKPDKPCGLYLLLKFCSVRKCIVTSLKSTAIYKLTLLHKPLLWQPNRHHSQGNYLV